MLDSQLQQEHQTSYNLSKATQLQIDNLDSLVRSANQGDEQAFNHLINQVYADIYRFSFHLSKNKTQAEDLTHDVILKIAKSIRQFKFNCAFLSWVYRIVVNTQKDNHKKQINRLKRDGHYFDQQHLRQHSPQPDENLEFGELLEAIDQLPEKLKVTLILVYAEYMTHADAADVLQCSINTVSWRVHEAKKQLKKILEKRS